MFTTTRTIARRAVVIAATATTVLGFAAGSASAASATAIQKADTSGNYTRTCRDVNTPLNLKAPHRTSGSPANWDDALICLISNYRVTSSGSLAEQVSYNGNLQTAANWSADNKRANGGEVDWAGLGAGRDDYLRTHRGARGVVATDYLPSGNATTPQAAFDSLKASRYRTTIRTAGMSDIGAGVTLSDGGDLYFSVALAG